MGQIWSQGNDFDRGLKNTGNTCYMNSALQCLHKSRQFTDILWVGQRVKAKFQTLRTFELYDLFGFFNQQMWLDKQDKQAFDARNIKDVMEQKNPIFKRNSEKDATQFILTFLLMLSQELNDPTGLRQQNINHYYEDSRTIYLNTRFNNQTLLKSIVEDIFTGMYKVVYVSTQPICRHSCVLFEKFYVHKVDIPSKVDVNYPQSAVTLQQCLKYSAQILKPQNFRICNICNMLTFNGKTKEIYQASKILVLSFQRFLNDQKIDVSIIVPEFIQPREFITEPQLQRVQGMKYKLYAAINHVGDRIGGHYTAVCYNYKCSKWMKYDDQKVEETSQTFSQIDFSNAVTLFYELYDSRLHNNTIQ